MTKDDIISMAREAGIGWGEGIGGMSDFLERFAALVAAAEREACAKVCDIHARGWEMNPGHDPQAGFIATSNCAAAIRARDLNHSRAHN